MPPQYPEKVPRRLGCRILDWKFLGCLGFVGLGTVGWWGVGLIWVKVYLGVYGLVQDPFAFPTALVETVLAAGCA